MNDARDLAHSAGSPGPTGDEVGGAGGGVLRGVGIGCGVLVAVPVLLVLGFLVTYSVQRGTPEEYERVDPQAMMTRIGDVSRESYEVLGFETAAGSDASAGLCYPGGLESMADEPVDGAYSLSHRWSVDDVPESGAASALKRLHGHLRDGGWDIDSYESDAGAAYGLELRVSRDGPSDDGGDIRAVFEWRDHRGRFEGGVHAPCAYDPGAGRGTWSATDAGAEVEPPRLGP
ncbi:hypothetical protein [Streptomyces sp. IB2014 016-6]|uniref:hypothetical protein n=1 Tax=Streptomyces sp. IB2014 016-6 TaxID=2517818 RepID=UPI0011CB5D9E|nr:hypothetical protein [Streptomyces sp. IB2014 016-6]TXL84651.1 hypothetical protein EW053_33875 [Streptomyces sp. IB2014 016-6]